MNYFTFTSYVLTQCVRASVDSVRRIYSLFCVWTCVCVVRCVWMHTVIQWASSLPVWNYCTVWELLIVVHTHTTSSVDSCWYISDGRSGLHWLYVWLTLAVCLVYTGCMSGLHWLHVWFTLAVCLVHTGCMSHAHWLYVWFTLAVCLVHTGCMYWLYVSCTLAVCLVHAVTMTRCWCLSGVVI